ncbi:MAG: Zn-ribbon domain-containing OB-fold protein [Deltaproteobacteria bacterium]|nr:Zn-ribbon domain-containing OB-fold protein [Deltaproteobacteria bacterium]
MVEAVKSPEFPVKEYKTGNKDTVLPYNWALGPTWTKFFNGLKEEKILGTRCKKCNRVLVPARTFCPSCYKDMEDEEWVEVAQEGTVETWCLVNYKYYGQPKEPPYIIAQICLDRADCSVTHFIGGFDLSDPDKVREKMKSVSRIKAVWSKEKHADIYDIAYFEPV